MPKHIRYRSIQAHALTHTPTGTQMPHRHIAPSARLVAPTPLSSVGHPGIRTGTSRLGLLRHSDQWIHHVLRLRYSKALGVHQGRVSVRVSQQGSTSRMGSASLQRESPVKAAASSRRVQLGSVLHLPHLRFQCALPMKQRVNLHTPSRPHPNTHNVSLCHTPHSQEAKKKTPPRAATARPWSVAHLLVGCGVWPVLRGAWVGQLVIRALRQPWALFVLIVGVVAFIFKNDTGDSSDTAESKVRQDGLHIVILGACRTLLSETSDTDRRKTGIYSSNAPQSDNWQRPSRPAKSETHTPPHRIQR